MTEVDTTELRRWGQRVASDRLFFAEADGPRVVAAADELDSARAELATLRAQRDAVIALCEQGIHTVNLGSDRHPRYKIAVLVNDIAAALAALGVQGDDTNG